MTFEEFDLGPRLLDALKEKNFVNPTPVQEKVIPYLLDSKDIIAQAETGSGKTGAFVFPILKTLSEINATDLFKNNTCSPLFVIISPTRELAAQIDKYFIDFGQIGDIRSACIVGGEGYQTQIDQMKKGVHVLTATPGRLKDLYQRKIISFNDVKGVVLDEADRLIDMGFKEDITYLLRKMPPTRQLMMFSATSGIDLMNMAYQLKASPVEINLSSDEILSKNVEHTLAHVGDGEKIPLLIGFFNKMEDGHCLVFCNTKSETKIVAKWLQDNGHKALDISGDLPQKKRNSVLKDFREKNINILVCTDVAARGLDIKGVNLVINYDLPQDPASYVHRIGRTGRAGRPGRAISFCGHHDCEYLEPIEKYIEQKINPEVLTEDMFEKDVGDRPKMETQRQNQRRPQRETTKREPRRNQRTQKPQNKREFSKPRAEKPSTPKVYKKAQVESTHPKKAKEAVLSQFPVNTVELLDHIIIQEGKRTMFGFGPKKSIYEIFIRPNFQSLANVFLQNLFQFSPFDISFKTRFENNTLVIDLNGPDEELFLSSEAEPLDSLEYLVRKFIHNLTPIPKNFKVMVNCAGFENSKEAKLKLMAEKLVKLAMKKKDSVFTTSLPPSDRYIVHQHLDSNTQVKTSSIGQGFYKKIKIDLK